MTGFSCRTLSALLAGSALAGSVFLGHPVLAQRTTEVGVGLGGLNYRGEVAPRYRFLNNRPAGTVFFRRDISAPLTLRAGLMLGRLYAADANVRRGGAVIPVAARRQAVLRGWLLELHGAIEYNFLDYYDQKRRVRWTPYFLVGAAGYYGNVTTTLSRTGTGSGGRRELQETKLSIAVPVGVGIKYALSTDWNLGLEVGARRTFGDTFDNLSDEEFPFSAQPYDPDWYFYNGISISYTFYSIQCPDVYRNGGMRLLR